MVWWVALPLLALVFWAMLAKGSWKMLPWFFAYITYAVSTDILRFTVSSHRVAYSYVYWASEAGYAVLGIAVMYEVVSGVFQNIHRTLWFRLTFIVAVTITFVLAISRTMAARNDLNGIMTWIVGGEMGVRVVEVAVFVLMVAMVALLGLRWRQHQFGICAGFGIYSSCALLASTKYYEIGSKFNFWFSVISVVSYTVAVLIWLWYFSTPIKVVAKSSEQPPLSLQDLERYKDIARRVSRP